MSVLRLLLNCPDKATAERIAAALLDAQLIACANVYPPMSSHYVWEGSLRSETEVPLILKTRTSLWTEVEASVLELHPYDVPPLIGDVMDFATADFAAWVIAVTKQPNNHG